MDKKPSKLLKWLEEIYPSEEKGNFITKLAGKTGIPKSTLYKWNDEELEKMKTAVSSQNYTKLIDFIAEHLQIEVPKAREKLNEFNYECFKNAEYKTIQEKVILGRKSAAVEVGISENEVVEDEETESITTEDEVLGNDVVRDEEKGNVTVEDEVSENDTVEDGEKGSVTVEDEVLENDVVRDEEKVITEDEEQGSKAHICIALKQLLDRMEFEIITSEFVSGEECILWKVRCKEEERLKKMLFFNEKPDILKRIIQVNVMEDNYTEQRQWVDKCGFDKKGFIFINCENSDICEKVKANIWSKQHLLLIGIEGESFFTLGYSGEETKKLWKYIQAYI